MTERTLKQEQAEIRRLNAKRRRLQGKDAGHEKVKRLSVSETARALLNKTPRELSYVSLSRSTVSPNVGIEIKVYIGESDNVTTVEAAQELCTIIFDELAELYPRVEKAT